MTADDFVYNVTDAQLADIYALDTYSSGSADLRGTVVSPRMNKTVMASRSVYESMNSGIRNSVQAATVLGLMTDENSKELEALYKLLVASEAAFAAYSIVHSMVVAKTAIETALAAAETSMHALYLDFGTIALAAGAAAGVYSITQFASGNWTLPSVDISTPSGRSQAANSVSRVSRGD